ncbi:pentapeptide repeat-containing protein [Nocardiopsis aegyptia]|uniref:pentapeptide repeat-containing protein n=1 Tax=Nocardiopsis aegyptia TaxID=220378 RepID=UPI00366CC9B3
MARRNPVRTAIVCAGLVLTAVAGSPLAVRGWEALWSLPHAGRLALCAIALAAVWGAALGGVRFDLLQRAEHARLGSVIAVAWAVVVVVVALLVTAAWWVMGAPRPLLPEQLPPRTLDAIATRAFAVVAGLGAAALLVISYRRQRTTEAENARAELTVERESTRLFNERFTAAYTNLGSEHAAVRLGAVHALASLADDAPSDELVQMVIDVLCAYLRVPYRPAPEPLPEDADDERREAHHQREVDFAAMREVRHTVIRVIGDHLREPTRWRGKDYDFTGVVFDGGDFHGAVFSEGRVDFRGAEFTSGTVVFGATEFSGGTVIFRGAEFSGGRVDFSFAEFFGGEVEFTHASFFGGDVDFHKAGFAESKVSFRETAFSGGRVDFRSAEFSGGEMTFEEAEGACPEGLLDALDRGEPRIVVLPEAWQAVADRDRDRAAQDAPTADHPDPDDLDCGRL